MAHPLRIGILTLAVAALASVATAQEEFVTGTVTGTVGGTEYTAHTWAGIVPEDAADHTDNEQLKEMLRELAGKAQHSASFMFMEGISMGGIALSPDLVYVSILTRTDNPEDQDLHSFKVDFTLDPETLELVDESDVQVEFYLDGFSRFYSLTEGTITLMDLVLLDESTLSLAGTVSGRMVLVDGFTATDETVDLQLTFDIGQVASSDTAYRLITGD